MQNSFLKELYIEELRDIYDAENQLVKALPEMAKAATSEELRSGFEKHPERTKEHARRLEQVLNDLGEKASSDGHRLQLDEDLADQLAARPPQI
jgi:ferritin-like metal-binding protein YciE